VKRVYADFSCDIVTAETDPASRLLDQKLGAGALLDMGLYALTWIFQTLYHTQPPQSRKKPNFISAHAITYQHTSATTPIDDVTTMLIGWPDCIGIGTCSLSVPVSKDKDAPLWKKLSEEKHTPAVRIQGTEGEITVPFPAPKAANGFSLNGEEQQGFSTHQGVNGWCYEADEVARCLRDGKNRSDVIPEEESVLIMEVLDELRKQCGIQYPTAIEKS